MRILSEIIGIDRRFGTREPLHDPIYRRHRTAIFSLTTDIRGLWDVGQVDAKVKRIQEQYVCPLSLNSRVRGGELFAVRTKACDYVQVSEKFVLDMFYNRVQQPVTNLVCFFHMSEMIQIKFSSLINFICYKKILTARLHMCVSGTTERVLGVSEIRITTMAAYR